MFVFYHQNVGRNHNIETANKSFKNDDSIKNVFGIALTNHNC